MSDAIIRRAVVADIPAILECLRAGFSYVRDVYSSAAFAATVLDEPSLRARMAAMQVLVAVRPSGLLIGTIACGAASPEIGHIRGMAVLPASHGAGVASALLDAALDAMRDANCVEVRLGTTPVLARAIAFYEKHGFVRTGCVSAFHGMELHEFVRALEASPPCSRAAEP